ncbi:S8 family serine peptidase [Umezawaea sp. Da 62-37]|uniref:S8 family peptidase n=1 Tax=Umezawaea sp. Da 62-37 TaxID=3075927 RepID=UPI0028F6E02E|nr:S8 family serine peptidase [Umezawaea sp. Da 62-37]WNV90862.1 S8 family serine peptidase [Umezawaea sp. Da 62-37]
MGDVRESWARRAAVLGLATTTAVAITAALTGASAGAAPEGDIRGLNTAKALKDSYIVVLKGAGAADVSSTTASLSAKYDAKVKHTYQSAVRGFSASMTEQQARKLAADPAVAYVEQDSEVSVSDTQTPTTSWGIDRIDQHALPLDNSYTYPNSGEGVTAYIIDTGIRFSHSEFTGGRAVSGIDTVDNDADATDCAGHGTHVSGTVGGTKYGVAKAVKLVAVRVLNCAGSGTYEGVIAGIDWVTQNHLANPGPAVANMSLGGGANDTVDLAVTNSIAAGVTYGLAAGNSYGADACTTSPARTPNAITVGATERTDVKAVYSNIGTCLDIFGPGTDITSSWLTDDNASNTISGTSMATPHVVGAAAVYLATHPAATPAEVRDALVNGATAGAIPDPGTGSPNKLLFLVGGVTGPPPTGCTPQVNDTDVAIPDKGAGVTSSITISGCKNKASTTAKVEVHVKHTYRGDVELSLITPSGAVRMLKASNGNDTADDVNATYTLDLSTEIANGEWKLQAKDVYAQDTGSIDSWTLTI